MDNRITPTAFEEADGLHDWRVISEGGCIFFRTASFAESARLAQAIAGCRASRSTRPRSTFARPA